LPELHAAPSVIKPEDDTLRLLFIGPRSSEVLSLRAALEHSSADRFRVLEVESTDESIAVLHNERFHLLVLDDSLLMSTRRKSLEVLRQAAPSTPIILRTTYRSYQGEADAAQVGAEAVLPRDEMLALCQVVLRIVRRMHDEWLDVKAMEALTKAESAVPSSASRTPPRSGLALP
jgi:DNA-binding NarL/FixJ family response regulator